MVTATIIQFRRGRKNYTPRHFLIEIPAIDSREKASKFVGKETIWTSTGKEPTIIKGKVSSAHGGNGVVRAIFEKGLPGQAIGTNVEVLTQETKPKKSTPKAKNEQKIKK